MAQLTIGMPVYNGERFITQALRSLVAQDFRDWEMLIADNCSTDRTVEIIREFCRLDPRIRLVQHEQNIGQVPNFLYLAKEATSPYFIWAAADDEWSPNYVGSCMAALTADPELGFAGGAVVNIDAQSNRVRTYKPFFGVDAESVTARLVDFLIAREVDGKANMIHSVYRTHLIQAVCEIPNIFGDWGCDMAVVAASLARARYVQVPNAELLKRVVSEADIAYCRQLDAGRYDLVQFDGYCPPDFYHSYVSGLLRGMPTFSLRARVFWTMTRRCFGLWLHRKFSRKKNG